MELHEQILCEIIAKEIIPSLTIDGAALVEMKWAAVAVMIFDRPPLQPGWWCFLRFGNVNCSLAY